MAMPEWLQRKQAQQRHEARERRAEYIEGAQRCASKIKERMAPYKENRDAIAAALFEVFSKHYYLGEYDNFKDWFQAQGFNFSLRTAQFYICAVRKSQESQPCASSNKKTPQTWIRAIERALKLVEAEYKADPDPTYDKAAKHLRQALDLCKRVTHATGS